MKNTLKKLGAIALVLMLMLSLSVNAFAADFDNGVAGAWTEVDTEKVQDKSINIKKEIISYNANASTVNAPVVTYTYTVTPASVDALTITDAASNHNSNTAVVAPVKAGITTGLVVTGTAAGSAGNATSATGTLIFTNATTLKSSADGTGDGVNSYNINLNFAGVTFTQPGVYRYQIAETIDAASYDVVAMKDGSTNTVYLDVYVDGDLAIYGYVCMAANASVTTSTTKVNGFVGDGAGADNYYTYDLTLSKDVVNDNYAATNNAFPFTVTFTNPEGYTSTFTIGQTVGTGSTGLNNSAATLTGLPTAWSGTAQVKDGDATEGTTVGDIVLRGIPAGVDVSVKETNNVTGVTYQVSSKVNGTVAATDAIVAPSSESTAVSVDTNKIATTVAQAVQIVNTLVLISPTGVAMRIAPYALMLIGGLVLLVISRRRKAEEA